MQYLNKDVQIGHIQFNQGVAVDFLAKRAEQWLQNSIEREHQILQVKEALREYEEKCKITRYRIICMEELISKLDRIFQEVGE